MVLREPVVSVSLLEITNRKVAIGPKNMDNKNHVTPDLFFPCAISEFINVKVPQLIEYSRIIAFKSIANARNVKAIAQIKNVTA